MKMSRLVVALTVSMMVFGCGSDDASEAAGGQGGSAGASSQAGAGQGGSSGAGGASSQGGASQGGAGGESSTLTASLSGKLTDQDDNPLEGYRVQLCYHACRTAQVGADGSYSLPKVEAATHLVEVWPGSTGPNADTWLSPTFPLTLGEHEAKTLDLRWIAPDKRVNVPETAASLEIADGLFVTLGKDTANPSLYLTGDFNEVYGVHFPDEDMPPIDGVSDPVGFWVLGPAETTSKSDGFPVQFNNAWSLPDGTTLHVWFSKPDESSMEGKWVSAGDVTVTGNEIKGDAKIPSLGTVLLSK